MQNADISFCHSAFCIFAFPIAMKLIRKISDFPESQRGGAVAIGNFDGVHRGHSVIINQLKKYASQLGGPAIVFTFDPHPVRILRPEQTPPPLTWTNRKADLLAELGVDIVVAYPTDRALLQLTHEEFFDQVVVEQLGAKAMVEGPNFFFGKDRQGNVENLAELCKQNSIELNIVQPMLDSESVPYPWHGDSWGRTWRKNRISDSKP